MKFAEERIVNNSMTLEEVTDKVIEYMNKNGLISVGNSGNLAMPRKQEIMAAFNRYRKLKV